MFDPHFSSDSWEVGSGPGPARVLRITDGPDDMTGLVEPRGAPWIAARYRWIRPFSGRSESQKTHDICVLCGSLDTLGQ